MSKNNKNCDECLLPDFDDSHAEIFYSFPFKIEDNYMFQYKITINNEIFELEIVKSYNEDEEEDENNEFHCPEDDNSEIVIKKIVTLPFSEAIGKIRNRVDLRKDLKSKFTEQDELSDLYDDILSN